jgi:hypothetical protein
MDLVVLSAVAGRHSLGVGDTARSRRDGWPVDGRSLDGAVLVGMTEGLVGVEGALL